MLVTARSATAEDIPDLVRLYRLLEEEMVGLSALWPATLGLAEPLPGALADAIRAATTELAIGEIDGVPVGFGMISEEPTVDPEVTVAAIRLIHTEFAAREVGVAAAVLEHLIGVMERRGHTLFDAHVLPGHRLAKNFFEASGFKARHIVMHRR